MTEQTAQKQAIATPRGEEAKEGTEKLTDTRLNLSSLVITFAPNGEVLDIEDDGNFELTISASGDVTGNHTRPDSTNEVTGRLLPTTPPRLILTATNGSRFHSGAQFNLGGERYIGKRKPTRAPVDALAQEEGVWVGTKVGP